MKTWKDLFAIHELWKHGNVHLKQMNLKHEFETRITKIFVCNTWIMKRFICKTWIMKTGKYYFAIHCEIFCLQNMNYEKMNYMFAIHELWKMEMFVYNTWIMKTGQVCKTWIMKISVCNTWIMKTGKY